MELALVYGLELINMTNMSDFYQQNRCYFAELLKEQVRPPFEMLLASACSFMPPTSQDSPTWAYRCTWMSPRQGNGKVTLYRFLALNPSLCSGGALGPVQWRQGARCGDGAL